MNFVRVLFSNNGENRSAPRRNVRQELKLHEARVINTPLALREQRCFAHWVRISANSTTGKTTPQNRNCNHREMHIAVMGGIRRDTVPAADAAVFRPLFIAIPWTRNPGPMLIFSRFQGARQHDWPIICRLYPIYHRCIVRVIRFNRVSMPRKSEKTKISPFSPPRYAHAFFYLSDRWPPDAKTMDDIFQWSRDKTNRHESAVDDHPRRGWKTNVVNQVWRGMVGYSAPSETRRFKIGISSRRGENRILVLFRGACNYSLSCEDDGINLGAKFDWIHEDDGKIGAIRYASGIPNIAIVSTRIRY